MIPLPIESGNSELNNEPKIKTKHSSDPKACLALKFSPGETPIRVNIFLLKIFSPADQMS